MGQQIIRQPDGKYAVWSSVVDSFVMIDAEPHEIADYWVEVEAGRLRESVNRIVAELEAGGRPYHQFTKTWDEALRRHEEIHGTAFNLELERLNLEAERKDE